MGRKTICSIFFLISICPWSTIAAQLKFSEKDSLAIIENVRFEWQNDFSKSEKKRVKKLLTEYAYYSQNCIGVYPFELRFYITNIKSPYRPLGFCQAKFGKSVRGVYLPMDLSYDNREFLDMWQIPHEVSHLALPALGRDARWFFEGFATYMSREIMCDMGMYTEESLEEFYQSTFEEIRDDFQEDETFVDVLLDHQNSGHYTQYYRGGATFFYRANRALEKKYDTNIKEIVKEYQKEERNDDRRIIDVIHSWDNILGAKLFSSLMRKYRNSPAREVIEDVWQ